MSGLTLSKTIKLGEDNENEMQQSSLNKNIKVITKIEDSKYGVLIQPYKINIGPFLHIDSYTHYTVRCKNAELYIVDINRRENPVLLEEVLEYPIRSASAYYGRIGVMPGPYCKKLSIYNSTRNKWIVVKPDTKMFGCCLDKFILTRNGIIVSTYDRRNNEIIAFIDYDGNVRWTTIYNNQLCVVPSVIGRNFVIAARTAGISSLEYSDDVRNARSYVAIFDMYNGRKIKELSLSSMDTVAKIVGGNVNKAVVLATDSMLRKWVHVIGLGNDGHPTLLWSKQIKDIIIENIIKECRLLCIPIETAEIAFHPDDEYFALALSGHIVIIDANSGDLVAKTVIPGEQSVTALLWDEDKLLVGTTKGQLLVYYVDVEIGRYQN